jgi:hypothetical protein
MKKNLTELVFILDCSGSIHGWEFLFRHSHFICSVFNQGTNSILQDLFDPGDHLLLFIVSPVASIPD